MFEPVLLGEVLFPDLGQGRHGSQMVGLLCSHVEIVHGLDWPSVDKTVGSKRHSPNGSGLHRHTLVHLGRTAPRKEMLLWQNDAPMRRGAALPSGLDDPFVVVVEVLYPLMVQTVTLCVARQ